MNASKLLVAMLLMTTIISCSAPPASAPPTQSPAASPTNPPEAETVPDTPPALPIVNTQSGAVQGTVTNNILAFKGVPYAEPPIGELRWKLPQPPIPWTDVRSAADFGPACLQQLDPQSLVSEPLSEDCLTLNIWTSTADPNAKLPVMVWIHGGSLRAGAGSEPTSDGQALAERGVVLVSINYRLGLLGFFGHPALEAEAPAGPVNFGLYDQMAALQWVQQNIAAFGGDPQNVTLFGESAGAESVMAQVASPLTRGLFQRAIVESYGALSGFSREQVIANGVNYASAFGLAGDKATAAELRAVSADTILATPVPGGQAVVGDDFLPQSIPVIFENGTEAPVPLVIGFNSYEASYMDAALAATPPNYDKVFKSLEAVGFSAQTLYPDITDPHELWRVIFRDSIYATGTRYMTDLHSQRAPTWQYNFTYLPVKLRSELPGVPHAGELSFVFGSSELIPSLKGVFTPEDVDMSRRVMGYWVTFAKTGVPTPTGEPEWKATDAAQNQTMVFGETIATQPDWMGKQTGVYLPILKELLKNKADFMVLLLQW
jgi:para-nitrobenzyl esterase